MNDERNNPGWGDDYELKKLDEYKDYGSRGEMPRVPPELAEEKNIALCVIFSIITFGIYYIYWFYTISKRIQLLNQEYPNCAAEVLLYFLVPFYCLYWMYTRARKIMEASIRYWHYNRVTDEGTAYLLMTLFGFGIVALALMQNNFNYFARDIKSVI